MSSSTQSNPSPKRNRYTSSYIFELVLFAMLGSLMFCSKIIMEALPNIHLLGMLTITYTLVFRVKALIPIYVYVFLNGVYAGFAMWWYPYLYIWTVLWAFTMLLPRKMPYAVCAVVYPLLCGFHGAIFGILYAPGQALMYNLNWNEMMLWIAAGLPFDLLHCIGDVLAGLLILPFTTLLRKLCLRARLKVY